MEYDEMLIKTCWAMMDSPRIMTSVGALASQQGGDNTFAKAMVAWAKVVVDEVGQAAAVPAE